VSRLDRWRAINPFSANQLHPATWWVLGLVGVQVATVSHSSTALAMQCVAAIALTLACRERAAWARSMRFYLLLAAAVLLFRVAIRALFGVGALDGQAMLNGLTDGLRLAAILLSVAMASTLANPRRLLASTPAALYEIATAITVALNLAPELINSLQRGRRQSALRARSRGLGALRGIVIPTLEAALDNSLALAASMDARGFGNQPAASGLKTRMGRLAPVGAVLLWCVGLYALLMPGDQTLAGAVLLVAGLALAVWALVLASRSNPRTRLVKRPLSWQDYVVLGIALTWWLLVVAAALTATIGLR